MRLMNNVWVAGCAACHETPSKTLTFQLRLGLIGDANPAGIQN